MFCCSKVSREQRQGTRMRDSYLFILYEKSLGKQQKKIHILIFLNLTILLRIRLEYETSRICRLSVCQITISSKTYNPKERKAVKFSIEMIQTFFICQISSIRLLRSCLIFSVFAESRVNSLTSCFVQYSLDLAL